MAYGRIHINNYKNASNEWQDNYICDIREIVMPKRLFEVFEYSFKDIDIKHYDIFEYLY